jgi:N-acetylmuramoyl-L-alanine amidase
MNHSNWRFRKQFKRIYPLILMLMTGFFIYSLTIYATGEPDLKNKVHIIVIDAGHGGKDPGAIGSFAKEKDIALGVALKLGKYIEDNFTDVTVIYTRDKDVFIPLFDRADIANKANADLFISIHANSSDRNYVFGTETFVMGEHKNLSNFEVAKAENNVITLEDDYTTKYEGFDPNSIESYIIFSLMQRTYINQSLQFASNVQNEFREKARRVDRGVLQAGFLVLWRTTMPCVLIETGFISHPDEEKYLASQQGQDYLASAIFRAFRDYKEEIENSSNFERKSVQKVDSVIEEQKVDSMEYTLYYKVQLFSSKTKIEFSDPSLEGYIDIESFVTGKWNKYAVGKYLSYDEADKNLKKVREKYPDAFIIAVNKGTIIPVSEANKILK